MKRRRGTASQSKNGEARPEGVPLTQEASAETLFHSYVRPAILLLATAVLVSTPLLPSEAIVTEGSGATWHVMWLGLAVFSLVGSALSTNSTHRWTWADLCVGLLVGWHLLSAYLCDGNQRQAWNAAWQWASYGAIAVVFRQQLTVAKETRALVGVMLALAMAVSLHAYYQYGYSQPLRRAEFEKDPDAVLNAMGIPADTPARANAANRIKSVEPVAGFALTNSLAGYLLPWLLVGLGLAFWSAQQRDSGRTTGTLLLVAVLVAGVLVLTKSRTAWLAAAGGGGLILLYGRRSRWQLDWRWPAGIAAAALVIGLIAVVAGGLDTEVLTESPKSVLYRIEYWRATAGLIVDEPWFGVGPGNFKERYVNHKLPEASESVSDPHNFLLEIWSTAGTPALVALLALMFVTAWQLGRNKGEGVESPSTSSLEPPKPVDSLTSGRTELPIGQFAIYAGAIVGLLLAALVGLLTFNSLETTRASLFDREAAWGIPIIWLTAFVAYTTCYFGLKDWVERGELPKAVVVIAVVALLVNLLAAGAAIFPGVVNAAWLLWAIALSREERSAIQTSRAAMDDGRTWNRNQMLNTVIAAVCLAGLIGCYYTEYLPVMQGRMLHGQGVATVDEGKLRQAEHLFEQALAADPWSPDPRRSLAEMQFVRWLNQPQEERLWREFQNALQQYSQASPHHYVVYETQGDWLLLASRRIKSKEHLQAAVEAFEKAARCYPNSAFLHAQLAAVYAEQQRTADAQREADEAARLDNLCPHQEQKLESRYLHDPHWPPGTGPEKRPTAKEVIDRLRGLERPKTDQVP